MWHCFYFFRTVILLKLINHWRKITSLPQSDEEWFQVVLSLSAMKDLCMTSYTMVNHGMLNAFVERCIWRPRHFTPRLVRCLSHLMMFHVCNIFWLEETPRSYEDYQRRDTRYDGKLSGGDDIPKVNEELDMARGVMLGLNTWSRYIQMTSKKHIRLQVMSNRWDLTERMLWEHICYIWLTLQSLWIKVSLIHISSTYGTSITVRRDHMSR